MAKDPYRYFRLEAREILDQLSKQILDLEAVGGGAPPTANIERMLRASHTLKGAAGVVGHERIAKLAHGLEERIAAYARPDAGEAPPGVGVLLEIVDAIATELSSLGAPVVGAGSIPPAAPAPAAESVRLDVLEMDGLLAAIADVSVRLSSARARTSGLTRAEAIARQLGRWIDDARRIDRTSAPNWEDAAELVDRLRHEVRSERESLSELVESAERRAGDALEDARRLRLVPADTLFGELARAARDAAATTGLRVELETSGGAIRLDASVLELLRDALLQLVRNAVAHAIEPPPERLRAGKPEVGRIMVRFELHGARARVTCRDDGRGLDVEAMRRALVTRGIATEDQARGMDVGEVAATVMRRGVTTRTTATELAGRGVGMSLVSSVVDRLRGAVAIRTEAGGGTEIELDVPVSVTAAPALVVEAGDVPALVPLDAVMRTARVTAEAIVTSPEGDVLSYEDGAEALPFASLARVLRQSTTGDPGTGAAFTVVLIDAHGKRAAIAVDRIVGVANDVVLPLPAPGIADPLVVGASLDAGGNPRLALDPRVLAERVTELPGAPRTAVAKEKKVVLVVDDSLTSRMLERSILEGAGYDVVTASSAEEALEIVRERTFALFVVDVEMPGMSGFDFVARTRSDPALSGTPAVLVTSRSAPEDRRRGHEVGARAYIVKGELAQDQFLDSVRRLIG